MAHKKGITQEKGKEKKTETIPSIPSQLINTKDEIRLD